MSEQSTQNTPADTAADVERLTAYAAHLGKPCGRPTPTGACPIVAPRPPMPPELVDRIDALYGPRACFTHATGNDRALAEVMNKTWNAGFGYGRKVGELAGLGQAEQLARLKRAHDVATGAFRERDDRHRQLITTSGGYTYHWNDPSGEGDLEIGDTVLLPANQVQTEHHQALVEGIGSSYSGATKAVLRLIARASGEKTW